MNQEQINGIVGSWIDEEDVPPRADLKIIRTSAQYFDPCEGMDEDEREAYWDLVHWAVTREHAMLLSIPKPQNEHDFWTVELDEFGNNVSAFNTMDFERLYPDRFNKYHYKLRKIYEQVMDLAITHSCISNEQGKKNTKKRFIHLVENEFRDRAVMLSETYKKYPVWMNKEKLLKEIAELNNRIRTCKEIWQKWAYQDE